jgi:hypothetical protein
MHSYLPFISYYKKLFPKITGDLMEYTRIKDLNLEEKYLKHPSVILEKLCDLKIRTYHKSNEGHWIELDWKTQITTSIKGKNTLVPPDLFSFDLLNDIRNDYPIRNLAIKNDDMEKISPLFPKEKGEKEPKPPSHWEKKKNNILGAALFYLGEDLQELANNGGGHGKFLRKMEGKYQINASALAEYIHDKSLNLWGENEDGNVSRGYSLKKIKELLSKTFKGEFYPQ